ncbi:MAG TPA: alanine racemase [Armatimonadota bacterium]
MNKEFQISGLSRYGVCRLDDIETPRPLFFEWAILANLDRIVKTCGSLDNLRLMTKTFKSSAVLKYYVDAGLKAIKASSVREARAMLSNTTIKDVLVSFPLFGHSIDEFLKLCDEYPDRSISVLVNNMACARALAEKAKGKARVFIDIDPGMRRTGVTFGTRLVEFAGDLSSLPNLEVVGLHIYDGNIHHTNPHAVSTYSNSLMGKIDEAVTVLQNTFDITEVVTSSSLTMKSNLLAYSEGKYTWKHTVSPGTSVLWDSNYNDIMPGEYDYACAIAVRIVDVIPNADGHIITTDCGTKFGASVDIGPVHVCSFNGYRFSAGYERYGSFCFLGFDRESGEPLESDLSDAVGKVLLVVPRHVCPTVSQYEYACLVRDGSIAERIDIDARDG